MGKPAEIQVVVGGYNIFNRNVLRYRAFSPVCPPCLYRGEVIVQHGSRLRKMFVSLWHFQTVEPHAFGWHSFLEKQKIGVDVGVWGKYVFRQTDYGMQIAVRQQFLLDSGFDTSTKQETVRENHETNQQSLCYVSLPERTGKWLFPPLHRKGDW